jgi:hypothetical protein
MGDDWNDEEWLKRIDKGAGEGRMRSGRGRRSGSGWIKPRGITSKQGSITLPLSCEPKLTATIFFSFIKGLKPSCD